MKRRCGFLKPAPAGETSSPVWLRGKASTSECPKTAITAESLALLEDFFGWKLGGPASLRDLPAKVVDAYSVLENEWLEEKHNAQRSR